MAENNWGKYITLIPNKWWYNRGITNQNTTVCILWDELRKTTDVVATMMLGQVIIDSYKVDGLI